MDWIGNWLAKRTFFVQLGHPDTSSIKISFKINIISALKDEKLTVDQDLYLKLSNKYKNVSLDDRDLSLGKKIKDSELVGIPWTVIIGKNYEQNNQYEIINRSTGEKLFLSDNEVENFSFEQYTP